MSLYGRLFTAGPKPKAPKVHERTFFPRKHHTYWSDNVGSIYGKPHPVVVLDIKKEYVTVSPVTHAHKSGKLVVKFIDDRGNKMYTDLGWGKIMHRNCLKAHVGKVSKLEM